MNNIKVSLKKKQSGFLMIEALLVVVIVLSLTLWWVKQENRQNNDKITGRIKQQTVNIMSAMMNSALTGHNNFVNSIVGNNTPYHFVTAADTHYDCIKLLDHTNMGWMQYLSPRSLVDPFGNPYFACRVAQNAHATLHTNSVVITDFVNTRFNQRTLQPTTTEKDIQRMMAFQKASSYFANGDVMNLQSIDTQAPHYPASAFMVHVSQPITNVDALAVSFVHDYTPGQLFSRNDLDNDAEMEGKCSLGSGMHPEVSASIVSCQGYPRPADANKRLPIEACAAKVTPVDDPDHRRNGTYNLEIDVLTPTGWYRDTNAIGPDDNIAQVTVHCVHDDN